MPGITLTPDVLPKYVSDLGYEIIASEYMADALIFPRLGTAVDMGAMTDAPFGHRASGIVLDASPAKREPGQEHEARAGGAGPDWQMATPEYAAKLAIPDEILEGANAQGRVVSMITEFTTTFARDAGIQKDQFVAGMLQKGTLTAGSAQYFDNSYTGKADPNPKFIYDGLPWFDTAHTISFGSTTYSNHTVSSALTTANLDTALTTMTVTNAVDERGKRVMINPNVLLVPRGLRSTALQILNSESLPGTAQNDVNPLRGSLDVIVSPWLTDDSDAWWILQAGRGLIYHDSGAPRVTMWRDEDRKSTMYGLSYRFGATVTDWRYHFACNKAAS